MTPRILFACRIEDSAARARIAALGTLVEDPTLDRPEKIAAAAAGASALIVPFTPQKLVTSAVLDALPELRLVGTTYGGLRQNVDDLHALAKGLCVIHTGPTRVRPMAEYTLALALAALTRIAHYHLAMTAGNEAWPREKFGRTRVLHQRRVGVIGYGLIGRGIAELFHNFTPHVLVHSEHASAEELVAAGFAKASLPEIFTTCEVVILAGGSTPKTHRMIGAEHFALMPDEAIFINVARGQMVRQEELIAALASRNIFAALDVFENEPLEADSPLRHSDRVLLAPHRANAPREFEKRWEFLADELERFVRGERPLTALSAARSVAMSAS